MALVHQPPAVVTDLRVELTMDAHPTRRTDGSWIIQGADITVVVEASLIDRIVTAEKRLVEAATS